MDQLTDLRERLLDQAYLFDEPASYVAGVEDTLREVASLLGGSVTIDLTDAEPTVRLTAN